MADQNLVQLADYYDKHAWEVWFCQQNQWSDDEDMLEGDYNDHLTVAHFVRQGLLDKARHYLWRMDTAARDQCPDKVYDVLYPDY